jgi:hypothetical protein
MVGAEDSFEYSEDLKDWTQLVLSEQGVDVRIDLVADGSVETRSLVVQLSEDAETAFVRRKVKAE